MWLPGADEGDTPCAERGSDGWARWENVESERGSAGEPRVIHLADAANGRIPNREMRTLVVVLPKTLNSCLIRR